MYTLCEMYNILPIAIVIILINNNYAETKLSFILCPTRRVKRYAVIVAYFP